MARLATAHVLIKCTDPDHDGTCGDLRDDLMANFFEVKRASTVTSMGDMEFCVRGIATINPAKRAKFEAALREFAASVQGAAAPDVRVYVETR